ncbi:MAG: hypothetical protein QNI90_05475 [Dinoroseobacter sp.]|nr:hypothetical protein [Dinoroseobacter sp.]
MQQMVDKDFRGITLAILFGEKVIVSPGQPSEIGPKWSLPQVDRIGQESPADCALRLLKATLDLELPVTRLNWPIVSLEEGGDARWFFTAWITPMEWDVITETGGLDNCVMLSLGAFLDAPTIPEPQKAALRSYLDQPKPHFGHG